jgi:hypothetical protein
MASLYVLQAIDPDGVSVASGSGSIPTSMTLLAGNGVVLIRKHRHLGAPAEMITTSCAFNVSYDPTLVTPVDLDISGYPPATIASVSLVVGPPRAIRFTFVDTQVLDIEFNSPLGNITYNNTGATTIDDLVIAINAAILE